MKKRIIILGSTGSIGRNCLEVLDALRYEFEVVGLAAQNQWERLAEQARAWNVSYVAISDESHAPALRRALPRHVTVIDGPAAMETLVSVTDADMVVCAVVGAAGLAATVRAAGLGRRLALANKEAMVVAGAILMPLARRTGAEIIPVDSEHSAVFQALHAGRSEEIRRIILTASGGPFRTWPIDRIRKATVREALDHPTWAMGPKITIDSATMMNKALEIVEARWLFNLAADQIDVVVHPEAIVHSMVEFCDGSIIAQMGVPDMRMPIQYALTYPRRRACCAPRLDLRTLGRMQFEEPDIERFPALRLGREVARQGGTAGAVLNAANEVAVERFRNGEIGFLEIAERAEYVLSQHRWIADPTLEELMEADRWARNEVARCVNC